MKPFVRGPGFGPGLVAALALCLSACFSSGNPDKHCRDISEYQAQRSTTGIVTPEGLAMPDHTSSYTLPPEPAPATGASAAGNKALSGATCLARPPDYFRKDPAAPAK